MGGHRAQAGPAGAERRNLCPRQGQKGVWGESLWAALKGGMASAVPGPAPLQISPQSLPGGNQGMQYSQGTSSHSVLPLTLTAIPGPPRAPHPAPKELSGRLWHRCVHRPAECPHAPELCVILLKQTRDKLVFSLDFG